MERRLVKSGIPGLDEILGGGFLNGSIVTIGGPTGCGKSTFAAQFLYNGATQYNEPGLYISIEESRRDFFFHVSGYNWDFNKVEKEQKFILLDYPIHEVDQILNQYSAIQEIINTTGVKRLVIDSIMPIALYFHEDIERKKGFLRLIDNIRKWGATTLIVSEDMKPTDIGAIPESIYGVESFTDGWISLFYHYDEKKMERTRFLEVLKMKGVQHSTRPYPALIDKNGIRVLYETAKPVIEEKPKPPVEEKKVAEKQAAEPQKPAKKTKIGKMPASIAAKLLEAKSKIMKKSK